MHLQIRAARPSDLDGLAAIETAVFPGDRLSRRSFRRLLASGSGVVEVAELATAVVGYFVLLVRKGSAVARLYSIAAAPGSTGVGRVLLAAAEEAARVRGAGEIRLEVRADNARAIGLYERNGYRRIGEIAAYYEDGQAALRFGKRLPAEATRPAPPGSVVSSRSPSGSTALSRP